MPDSCHEHFWHEATHDSALAGVPALYRALDRGLLRVVNEGNPDAFPHLDPGESSVLSAAAVTHAGVLVDDRKTRAVIETEQDLRAAISWSSGLLGLNLLAKRRGYIPAVQPLINDLHCQRFRIGLALVAEVLREAGEA